MSLRLSWLEGEWAVSRLAPEAAVPSWATEPAWFSISRTPEELTVVGPAHLVPEGVQSEGPWRMFRVEGTLAFTETGVLSGLSGELAAAGISVFVISTYDTDYVLVPADEADAARSVLRRAGYLWAAP